jgi:hypothetical protein
MKQLQSGARSIATRPVYDRLETQDQVVVGYIYSIISWEKYLTEMLPMGVVGVNVILRNSCGQSMSYELSGDKVRYRKQIIFLFILM